MYRQELVRLLVVLGVGNIQGLLWQHHTVVYCTSGEVQDHILSLPVDR